MLSSSGATAVEAWPSGISYGLFLGVSVPLSLVIGVASATIGFTSWMLLVPLLFAGFDMPLYSAILVSVYTDGMCGLVLSLVYGLRERRRVSAVAGSLSEPLLHSAVGVDVDASVSSKQSMVGEVSVSSAIDFRVVVPLALLAIAVQIPAGFVGAHVLSAHESFLRNGSGYISFIFGLLFGVKAFYARKKHHLEADERRAKLTRSAINSIQDQTASDLESASQLDAAKQLPWFQRSRKNTVIAYSLLAVGSMMMGFQSGFFGFGGATWFALLFVFILQRGVLSATASGCFAMLCCMVVQLIMLSSGALPVDVRYDKIWPYLLPIVGTAVVGAVLGTLLTTRLEAWKLTLTVAAVLFLMGIIETLQGQLLKDHNPFHS